MGYNVEPYSIEALKRIFCSSQPGPHDFINNKQHFSCFENYLDAIHVETIVVEDAYVDRDYLEDYVAYYARSFESYNRYCKRIHLFNYSFDANCLQSFLRGDTDSDLTRAILESTYCGFIVLRPVPKKVIGRTCLKTYEHNDRRYFPCVRKYHVSFFGVSLAVSSVAFQEQDNIVAACASTALWSAFHSTAYLFQHALPSPAEITRAALSGTPYSNRYFPSKGLTAEQMAQCIRHVGLDPLFFNASDLDKAKSIMYAYLRGKIPVIMGIDLYTEEAGNYTFTGKHAVTILGYCIPPGITEKLKGTDFYLKSSRIDKVYVHDDQIGPFSKMTFDNRQILIHREYVPSIETTWRNKKQEIGKTRAVIGSLLVPVYHKIRIPYEKVLASVIEFDLLLKIDLLKEYALLEWDIYLSETGQLKDDVIRSGIIPPVEKEHILTTSFPKYIWRAEARVNEQRVVDFIFDATDIEHGNWVKHVICYSATFKSVATLIASNISLTELKNLNTRYMWAFFIADQEN